MTDPNDSRDFEINTKLKIFPKIKVTVGNSTLLDQNIYVGITPYARPTKIEELIKYEPNYIDGQIDIKDVRDYLLGNFYTTTEYRYIYLFTLTS